MKPGSKRRGKRAEAEESDEEAPLASNQEEMFTDDSEDESTANISKSSSRRGGKKSATDHASDASDEGSKQGSDKRRPEKRQKHNETDAGDQDDEASDKSESDADKEPAKPTKRGKQAKEKTAKKGKGKRGRKPKVEAPDDDEATNGNADPDNTDYEVEDIMGQRMKFGKLQYLIRWKGYGAKDDTWERADGLSCREIIKRYKQRNKEEREAESSADEKTEEFEVSRIKEVHFRRDGSREFLVGWKGFAAKDDTWEHESNMKCPEIISQFMRRVNRAKDVTLRELREHREPTKHYTANSFDVLGRRLSGRSRNKPRVNYFYDDQY